jgi:cytidine deaminase
MTNMSETEEGLKNLVISAQQARLHAITFRSSVGIAYETYDKRIFTGFNIETYTHKGEHAEEVGLMRMLAEGYMGTDVRRMVEVFQDAGHDKIEIFPACNTCWSRMWEFLHPYLVIVVADIEGNVKWNGTLISLFSGIIESGAEVYPSNKVRIAKPFVNFKPKLPLDKALMHFYKIDEDFRQYCDEILHVEIKSGEE